MKNTIKAAAVIALSLFAAACAKVTTDEPSKEGQELHFIVNTAENAVVKSFLENNNDGTYTPKWSKGDELAIFMGTISDNTKPSGVLSNTNETGPVAKFVGTVAAVEGTTSFKSFAPASAFAKGYGSGNVGITLSENQKPSSLTIDQSCDILVAKEASYTADAANNVVVNDLFFKRVFSVVKIALTGPAALSGEKVQKFSLTAPEGTVLAGRAAIDLSTAAINKWNISKNAVTATYTTDAPVFGSDTPGSSNVVWLVVNPGTIASDAKLTFSGETAAYTFSKEVTLSNDLIFPESQLAVINLTLADEHCTKKTTPSVVPVYASVAELIAAGKPTEDATKVTVTLTDEEIIRFHTLKDGTVAGAIIKVGTQEVEIFCKGTPSNWKVGGTISGTLTNCDWKLYNNSTWELCPTNYSELTYKAPLTACATPVITIAEGGAVSIACETPSATIHYTVGDAPADPTEADAVFSAVTLTGGQTIKAIAVAEGFKPSAVASKKYVVGGAESILVWDDDFSSIKKANTTALKSLNGSKTGFEDAYTIENCYPEVSSIKLSSSRNIGSIQTPKFTKLSGTSSVVVTIEYAGYGKDAGTLNLTIVGNGVLEKTSLTATNTATSGAGVEIWDKSTFVISGADKDTALKISASAKGKRFFINSIKIETN